MFQYFSYSCYICSLINLNLLNFRTFINLFNNVIVGYSISMKYFDRYKLKFSGSQVVNETVSQNMYLYMEHHIFNNKSIDQN